MYPRLFCLPTFPRLRAASAPSTSSTPLAQRAQRRRATERSNGARHVGSPAAAALELSVTATQRGTTREPRMDMEKAW